METNTTIEYELRQISIPKQLKEVSKNFENIPNLIKKAPKKIKGFLEKKFPEFHEVSYNPDLRIYGGDYPVHMHSYNPRTGKIDGSIEKIENSDNFKVLLREVRKLKKQGYERV